MTENDQNPTENDAGYDEKRRSSRTPRAIRFSGSEWERVETVAGQRGIPHAGFVRNTALAASESESGKISPEITAQIERLYRGVYLLATLKRDEMLRDGRREELDRVTEGARESQDSIMKNASE